MRDARHRIAVALVALYGAWIAAWVLHETLFATRAETRDFVYWTASKLVVWIALTSVILGARRDDWGVVLTPRAIAFGVGLGALWFGLDALFVTHAITARSREPLALVNVLVVAPLLEELLFRGLLWSRLTAAGIGPGSTCVVTAVAFVGLHLPGWIAMHNLSAGSAATLLVVGLFLGVGRLLGHSVVTSVLLHFANNLASSGILRG